MLVNKKLGRFKQWAEERMGGEVKTTTSDDFKALEMEMGLRHDGMEKLQRSMTLYVKSMSKRNEADDREKSLPIGLLGSTMVAHGDDFEPDSEFGNCLANFGRANERIARVQESYVSSATSTWLESLERSLAQLKEYQAARRKLEQRRLAYDTSQTKMQKQKKEDFRVEEELRSQKAKYEESNEDVFRRMQDIKEAELDSIADLTAFLDAELSYHDRCREILMQVKRDWPARPHEAARPAPRSRSNTALSFSERNHQTEQEVLPAEPRATIPRLNTRGISPAVSTASPSSYSARPALSRSNTYTFEGPARNQRDSSPANMPRLTRVPTEPSSVLASRPHLRSTTRGSSNGDVFDDQYDDQYANNSPQRGRSISPPISAASQSSRAPSWSVSDGGASGVLKKGPPPPPPSRAKKPPPPPPMKRVL